MKQSIHELTANEAILLQQIHEDGEDDTRTLSQQLGMSRHHILALVAHLKQKGLVAVDSDHDGLWVHLTRRGQHFIRYMWPEAREAFAV